VTPAEEKPVLPMINTGRTKFQHNIVISWFHDKSGWPPQLKQKSSDSSNHGALILSLKYLKQSNFFSGFHILIVLG